MSFKLFITGTDTEIGKTYVSVGLLKAFNKQHYTTIGLKPLASGCNYQAGKLYNDDALALQQAASVPLDYDLVNPFAYELAITPHLAAAHVSQVLDRDKILAKLQISLAQPADIHIIEGIGGWHVPLNATQTFADVVRHLNIPVLLVVGVRLGCLNHAILTSQAILNANIPLFGWVANCIDPNMLACADNIVTLKQWIKAPCLGVIGYQQDASEALASVPIFILPH